MMVLQTTQVVWYIWFCLKGVSLKTGCLFLKKNCQKTILLIKKTWQLRDSWEGDFAASFGLTTPSFTCPCIFCNLVGSAGWGHYVINISPLMALAFSFWQFHSRKFRFHLLIYVTKPNFICDNIFKNCFGLSNNFPEEITTKIELFLKRKEFDLLFKVKSFEWFQTGILQVHHPLYLLLERIILEYICVVGTEIEYKWAQSSFWLFR